MLARGVKQHHGRSRALPLVSLKAKSFIALKTHTTDEYFCSPTLLLLFSFPVYLKKRLSRRQPLLAHLTTRRALKGGGLVTLCSGGAVKPSKSSKSSASGVPPCSELSDRNITTGPFFLRGISRSRPRMLRTAMGIMRHCVA